MGKTYHTEVMHTKYLHSGLKDIQMIEVIWKAKVVQD